MDFLFDMRAEIPKNITASIRQQPRLSRMIGFENAGSYLYPELVVEIIIKPDPEKEVIDTSQIVCSIGLLDSTSMDDRSVVQRPARKNATPGTGMNASGDFYINLIGTKVATPTKLIDPADNLQKYFVSFHDLRVRVNGLYRINCMICDMSR
jgi:hypothetical protein